MLAFDSEISKNRSKNAIGGFEPIEMQGPEATSPGLSAELASQVQLLTAELAREKAGKLAGLK